MRREEIGLEFTAGELDKAQRAACSSLPANAQENIVLDNERIKSAVTYSMQLTVLGMISPITCISLNVLQGIRIGLQIAQHRQDRKSVTELQDLYEKA